MYILPQLCDRIFKTGYCGVCMFEKEGSVGGGGGRKEGSEGEEWRRD